MAAVHNLWAVNGSGTPTSLLGSYTLTSLFQNPTSAGSQGGPIYSWQTITPGTFNSYDHFDIGYEGVGVPISLAPTSLKGDMNNDGVVDNFDISPYEEALANPSQYAIDFPSVTDRVYRGDINNDSVFDNFDNGPFETLLTGGGAAPVPEPSTLVLMALGVLGVALGYRCRMKITLNVF